MVCLLGKTFLWMYVSDVGLMMVLQTINFLHAAQFFHF